jgi:hypothetical protein
MDKVRDLLIFFLKVSIGLFVIVLVIWLTASVPRSKKNTTTASSTPKVDILPSPRKYSGFFYKFWNKFSHNYQDSRV